MVNHQQLYDFLSEYYLHSRFEGSQNKVDFHDYAQCVTMSSMEQLCLTGIGIISKYDSRTGREIRFDKNLTIINKDEPPAQIQAKAFNSW